MAVMITLWILAGADAEVEPPAYFAGNEELHAYLLEAAEAHPGLRARYEEWLAALQRIPQVTALDDPMFTYGQFLQSEMNRFRVMFSQMFPWFGTLRARGERAAAEADAALERFYAERNRVFADVKRAYFEYAFLGEGIRVTEAQAQVLIYMEDIVRSKLALGLARQDELLRVAIEQEQLQDQYRGLLQFKPALMAQLNQALGREVLEERPWPQKAEFPPPLPPAPIVLARIRVANPELRAFDDLIQSREKEVVLAKKMGYPDFTVGIEYMSVSKPRQMRPDRISPMTLMGAMGLSEGLSGATPVHPLGLATNLYAIGTTREPMAFSDGGEDEIVLSLSVNLPIWRKRIRGGIQEARLMASATGHEKRLKTLSLDSAAQMAIFQVQDGERRYRLYEDTLLPEALQTYDSVQTAYSTGLSDASFLDVMESIRRLLEFELEQARAARDWQTGAAELEFLMAGPWSAQTEETGAPDASVRRTDSADEN